MEWSPDWSPVGEASTPIRRGDSDERLSTVLQNLLVSVERGIERLEWTGQRTIGVRDCSVQTSPTEEFADRVPTLNTVTTVEGEAISSNIEVKVQKKDSVDSGMEPSCRMSVISEAPDAKCDVLAPVVAMNTVKDDTTSEGSEVTEDEPDDGYHDNSLSTPSALGQVDQDLLHSGVAVLTGSVDNSGRSLVFLFLSKVPSTPASRLAELLMYLCSIPKVELSKKGVVLILVGDQSPKEATWELLDEAISLLESNVPESVHSMLLVSPTRCPPAFPTAKIKLDHVTKPVDISDGCARKDQLLPEVGGTYSYDHQEWISFRKFLEPFVSGCRLSGRRLVSVMQELRLGRLPPSASLTSQMIEQQKRHIHVTYQDEQLRHLEEEGDTILKELEGYRRRAPHNVHYSESLNRAAALYGELRRAMTRLSRLAERRLAKLQERLHLKTLAEESSQVLSWLCRRGEESLSKHQKLADNLRGIKVQEEDFEKFYFVAMRQIEKGNDLLEEASLVSHPVTLSSKDGAAEAELTATLKRHLWSFSERLEDTREKLEDTAKCYNLLDKAYEWALDTMHFVSRMKLEGSSKMTELSRMIRSLDDYLDEHPPIPEEVFSEMTKVASRLSNQRLTEQCHASHQRCLETLELLQARQATLIKARQHLELESFRLPPQEDLSVVQRAQRSHSHPQNFWPQSVSTPYGESPPYPQSYSRRRSMSSITPPAGFSSPFASYTAFPSNNAYPNVSSMTSQHLQLDKYLREKEEELQSQGLITEDLTPQGPIASISRLQVETRCAQNSGMEIQNVQPSVRSSTGSRLAVSKGSSPLTSGGSSLHPVSQRPVKKHMRVCPTWQLCEEALQKAADQVRQQNERLRMEKLLPEDSSQGSESGGSLTDQDDNEVRAIESGPITVNSHLLSRTSSLEQIDQQVEANLSSEDQARAKTTLMLIMRELIQTERDYVKSLEYIIENYIPELLREDIPQALRGQRNVIFGNIEKIFEFHSQYFLQELEGCQGNPFNVGQCFLQYDRQFYLYALYNKNKPKSDKLMSEYGTSFFRRKQLELADKMDLASYLLKPVQRMGKYALLLKQLIKECPETEKEAEHVDLKAAEEMVRFQLRHGNDLLAMDALRDCDVNVKEQGRLLRQDEFLVWQGRYRKSLRHVFLFEELILFSKGRRDPDNKGQEIYQYKHSIKTTDIGMTEQIGDSPTKFEIWFRKRKLHDTYILQAPSSEVKSAWAHEISRLLWKQALKNREIRLAEMSSMGIGNKPCLDIKPSEDQINERSIRFNSRVPRFRNSIAALERTNKRPHSIISVSSSSSSGSSNGSGFNFNGALNLGFEPGDSTPRHRSLTQQSQCSTESGFCTDTSLMGDHSLDSQDILLPPRVHKKAERSDSILSSDSIVTQPPNEPSLLIEESVLETTTEETT